jgi:hypothetical protein
MPRTPEPYRSFRFRALCSMAAVLALATTGVHGQSDRQVCHPDDKLIGRFQLSIADTPGTWWHLTRTGMEDAGIVGDAAQLDAIRIWFGSGSTD